MTVALGPSRSQLRALWAVLLAATVASWAGTVAWYGDMAGMPGSMGMALPAFLAMWAVMMAAMMLPSVAPLATLYARSLTPSSTRSAAFVSGYLVVWAGSGLGAFGGARVVDELITSDAVGTALAAGVFAACGVYQLTSLKTRCLRHCRSPLSSLFHYGSFRGRTRDFRVGLHHGAYCLGCCWALMLILLAVGVMNLAAMAVLAVVVAAEKYWRRGEQFSRALGVAALVAAIAVFWMPGLAPGLIHSAPMHM